jgi:hypothetical protein
MDQDAMVTANLAGGWRLIEALYGHGFTIDVAFWARLSSDNRWVFYIASPTVDERGLRSSYSLIHGIIRHAPEWGIDPFSVILLGVDNPMAKAAMEILKPKVGNGAGLETNRKPYRGVMPYRGSSLGGSYIDGAYIYPPWEAGLNPVGEVARV